jgi:cobalt-zinc-cadmium efflux system membrane fusion protein
MTVTRTRTAMSGASGAVILLAAISVGAVSCSKHDAPSDPKTTAASDSASKDTPTSFKITAEQRNRIQIVTEKIVSFQPTVEATGVVAFNGDRSTQVLSPVSGPATRVIGMPGMHVTRGQPLAYVQSSDFAAAVANYRKAQTAFRNAKRIADRDSALFKNDALARGDLEQAQSDQSAAEADVEASIEALRTLGVDESQISGNGANKTTPMEAIIRAPLNGTIVEKLISEGQLLQAGTTPTFTVTDLSTMWVMASVFANDLHDVAVGQSVDIFAGGSATPIPGKVDYIASLADPGTNAVSVRIVAANKNQLLRRDLFVRVAIKSNVEHHGLLVPVAAVLLDEQSLPFVLIANADGGFSRRQITRGHRVGNQFEVTSGLKVGDQVVSDGALFIQFAETQ